MNEERRYYHQPTKYVPRNPQSYVMYLYHEQYPQPPEKHRYLCGCGYTIFKASIINIQVANDIGMPWRDYAPGSHMIEVTCPNCKSKFTILFQ